jgi:iron complex transport system substrate-binding protein
LVVCPETTRREAADNTDPIFPLIEKLAKSTDPAMNRSLRIVSLVSSATEILFGLGLGDCLVGVSHECDYPPDALSLPQLTKSNIDSSRSSISIDHQVHDQLEAGMSLYEIDVQQLVALAPDVIIAQAQCDVCAVRYEDVAEAVESQAALQHTDLLSLHPQCLADVLDDILRLGEHLQCDNRAKDFVAQLQGRIETIRHKTDDIEFDQRPSVCCIEWIDPLMLAKNWMPELVHLAGGRYLFSGEAGHSVYNSWSEIVSFDPQALIIMPCGFDLERARIEGEQLTSYPDYHRLQAVLQRRVFAVDANSYFNRSGPRLIDSTEILAHLLHPHRFPPVVDTQNRSPWCIV